MEITIKNTSKIIMINGIEARVWEGETKSGIKVHAYIPRIAIDKEETNIEEFKQELEECEPPCAEVQSLPDGLIILPGNSKQVVTR